mmetsp:Transcript_46433/g.108099  ORF Transcript_46433/g.108099 Transcript_46433/m.108099 type:complete len:459 (-) Transcript_46433:101-1477(-)
MSSDAGEVATQVTSNLLLFMLLGGMAASVDTDCLRDSFKRWRGIVIGLLCQFILLPVVGLASVKLFDLKTPFGIALLATTASPGGAYSNWWCSLMNADLALSIAMTTCSTAASVVLMPVNIMVYTTVAYGENPDIDIWRILVSIGVAVSAILVGTIFSAFKPTWRSRANVFGNIAGIVLIGFGMLVSNTDEPIWNKEPTLYPAVAAPCIAGLLLSFFFTYSFIKTGHLVRPEAVSVCVEVCYQNTGLALSIALASFDGHERGDAAAVPLFYAVCQVILLPTFLIVAWKCGWTYAPSTVYPHQVVIGNFQPVSSEVKARSDRHSETSLDSSSTGKVPSDRRMMDGGYESQESAPNVVPSPFKGGAEPTRFGAETSPSGRQNLRKASRGPDDRAPLEFPGCDEQSVPPSEGAAHVGSPVQPSNSRTSPKASEVPSLSQEGGADVGCCNMCSIGASAGRNV